MCSMLRSGLCPSHWSWPQQPCHFMAITLKTLLQQTRQQFGITYNCLCMIQHWHYPSLELRGFAQILKHSPRPLSLSHGNLFPVLMLLLVAVWNSVVSDATEDRRFFFAYFCRLQQLHLDCVVYASFLNCSSSPLKDRSSRAEMSQADMWHHMTVQTFIVQSYWALYVNSSRKTVTFSLMRVCHDSLQKSKTWLCYRTVKCQVGVGQCGHVHELSCPNMSITSSTMPL